MSSTAVVIGALRVKTKVPLEFPAKFQLNIPSDSGDEVDYIAFAIFVTVGSRALDHAEFTILNSCSLIMLHVKESSEQWFQGISEWTKILGLMKTASKLDW